MAKYEYRDIAIFDDGCGFLSDDLKETRSGHYYTQDRKGRREILSIMSDRGWQYIGLSPADRSAAMCEHWKPEILMFHKPIAE